MKNYSALYLIISLPISVQLFGSVWDKIW